MEKVNLLKRLYFDPSGYQSRQNLYKEAKKADPTITPGFVNEWYDIFNERSRYYGKKNSFVAPHAHYEYQIDLFYLSDLEKQRYRYGMACIDIFSKYATVVPIPSNRTSDFLAGMMECLNNMKNKPLFIMSDNEGAVLSKDVKSYLAKENIQLLTTWNHANFVERFIRTFKFMLRKRMDYDELQGKESIQWHDYIFPIMLTYNHKNKHSATEMTPADAKKDDHTLEAKLNMKLKAKRERRYPELKVGDRVKLMLKYDKMRKEHNPLFSERKYVIEKIEEKHHLTLYTVNGRTRLRSEIMKTI